MVVKNSSFQQSVNGGGRGRRQGWVPSAKEGPLGGRCGFLIPSLLSRTLAQMGHLSLRLCHPKYTPRASSSEAV